MCSVASKEAVQTSEIIIRMRESGVVSLPSGGISEHGGATARGSSRSAPGPLLGICLPEGTVGRGREKRSPFVVWP